MLTSDEFVLADIIERILRMAREKNQGKKAIIGGIEVDFGGFTRVVKGNPSLKPFFFTPEEINELAALHPASPNETIRHTHITGFDRNSLMDVITVQTLDELFDLVWKMIRFTSNTPMSYTQYGYPWTSKQLEDEWEKLTGRVFTLTDEDTILSKMKFVD